MFQNHIYFTCDKIHGQNHIFSPLGIIKAANILKENFINESPIMRNNLANILIGLLIGFYHLPYRARLSQSLVTLINTPCILIQSIDNPSLF